MTLWSLKSGEILTTATLSAFLTFAVWRGGTTHPSPASCGHRGHTGVGGWASEWAPATEFKPGKRNSTEPVRGEAALIEMQWFFFDRWTSCYVPTCEDGFVGFKLLSSDVQAAVREARLLPQVPQVVRQLTLRDLQHVHVGLAWNVHRVLDDAYLQGQPDQTLAWQRARDFRQQQQQQEQSFI